VAALKWRPRVVAAIDALLGVYAQVLFARSRVTGALLLAATALDPGSLVSGLLAIAVAAGTVSSLGLGTPSAAIGPYTTNALLVGLAVAHYFGASEAALVLVVAVSVVTVLVTAALLAAGERAGGTPVLSLPFVLVCWMVLGVAPALGLHSLPALTAPPSGLLETLGALFFLPRASAGALVLGALLWHSRIALVFALAACTALAGATVICPPLGQPLLAAPVLLNGMLTTIAIGGVWFVPSPSSLALGLAGALASSALVLGLTGPLERLGLPALILPFNVAVFLVLHTARRRVFDAHPKSVDFVPGSPEENLAYYRTRLARFQAPYPIGFRLPFRGAWVCTQGVDGALTHRGPWRHAFDFEVADAEGRLFRGEGASVDDHLCHRLPVLATADGVVVKVQNDVPDNAIGQLNLERNWGNCVILRHGVGLYSQVAHLARGSVRVSEGQTVRRGDVLGACGNSGRSPRPHLHFQLQSGPALSAATLPCRFSDVVVRGAEECVSLTSAPPERATVRNLEPDGGLLALLAMDPGSTLAFRSNSGGVEQIEHEVDLLGNLVLRSRERGATLCFARTEDAFTAFDPLGAPGSVIHLLRAALARVPFDAAPTLAWSDYLPPRWSRSPGLRAAWDVLAPFLPVSGLEMRYGFRPRPDGVDVVGASARAVRGQPVVRTLAELRRGVGIARLEVNAFGRKLVAERLVPDADPRLARSPQDEAQTRRSHLAAGFTAWLRKSSRLHSGAAPRSPRAGDPSS